MRILGWDIGTFSVKAIEIDHTAEKFEAIGYYEEKLISGEPLQSPISRILSSVRLPVEKQSIYLPHFLTTFRNLEFPTRNKKVIQAGIPFELEDEFPIELHHLLTPSTFLNNEPKKTLVHVAITPKSSLAQSLHQWQTQGIDPDFITSETWAYRVILQHLFPSTQEPLLLLHLGHSQSMAYLHCAGKPIFLYPIHWGGEKLTTAICQKFHLSSEAGAQKKHQFEFSQAEETSSPEKKELENVLEPLFSPLFSEIKKLILSVPLFTQKKLKAIYLSGGSALIPGLSQKLALELKTPISLLPASVHLSFVLALGTAWNQTRSQRYHLINFRKGEFQKPSRLRSLDCKWIKKPLFIGSIIIGLFFLNSFIQSHFYQSKILKIQPQLERMTFAFFRNLPRSQIQTQLKQPQRLKQSIEKELEQKKQFMKFLVPKISSSLNFLNLLSKLIPSTFSGKLMSFQCGTLQHADSSLQISMTLFLSEEKEIDMLETLLKPLFIQFKKEKLAEMHSPQTWKVNFSGILKRSSYETF